MIEKGMVDGQKVVFHGEADQQPNTTPGDVIVILREIKDKKNKTSFKRIGPDLLIERKLSLCEALTGFSFSFEHLDGRIIQVNSVEGHIIEPGDIRVIEKEGMPQFKNPFNKGKLFIKFDVQFPQKDSLNDEGDIEKLKQVLSKKTNEVLEKQRISDKIFISSISENKQERVKCFANEYNETKEEMRRRRRNYVNSNNYNSDDEEGEGNGQSCRFQ